MTGDGAAGDTWIWRRCRLWLVYEIRRLHCPDCGVRTEELPWARPGARHTRDFEDTVLWLAQRTDRTSVATLMRCAWETVTAIINRGVAELLDARRLQTLYRIGVDEICYRHPHRYLTIIGDHDTGTVIDIQPGRSEQSLATFYQSQPDSIVSGIEVVSMDVSAAYQRSHPHPRSRRRPSVTTRSTSCNGSTAPWMRCTAEAATGPGRVAMSAAQLDAPPAGRCAPERTSSPTTNAPWSTRSPAPTGASAGPGPSKNSCATSTASITHPAAPAHYLRRWITAAKRSRINAFIGLAKRLEVYFEEVITAVELN